MLSLLQPGCGHCLPVDWFCYVGVAIPAGMPMSLLRVGEPSQCAQPDKYSLRASLFQRHMCVCELAFSLVCLLELSNMLV